jgi:FixJ family two-component response regulator
MAEPKAMVFVVDDVSVREALGSLIRSAGLRAETFAVVVQLEKRGRCGFIGTYRLGSQYGLPDLRSS